MGLSTSTEYREVIDQIRNSKHPCYYGYSCEFEVEGLVIPTMKVISIDEDHDFIRGFAPAITVTVAMQLDLYERQLFPNRKKLRAVIKKLPLEGDLTVPGIANTTYYTAVALDNTDRVASAQVNYDPSRGIGAFTFQLIPAPIEKLRLETCGGIFVDCTALDVLMVVLGEATKKRSVSSDVRFVGFSRVEPPKEMRIKPQIVVKHGTPLLDLPTYLQDKCGGIYNHSIGCFYYANKWYTYPIHDTARYNRTKRVLDIAVLPPKESVGYEKTYSYFNERAFVLSTRDFQSLDDRDQRHLVEGNGVRFSNASQMWDNFATTAGNKSTVDASANLSQFVITEREDGDQAVPFSKTGITDNICRELSKINSRNGTYVTINWKNCNADILYPGMPVKIHYPGEMAVTDTKERLGILVGKKVFTTSVSEQLTSGKMASEAALLIFLGD